ncbi:hypothetical protein GOP47_0011941 [Adiantum capillus-veneris]|uniref:Germin-like protein n=1 Tax=Adiantum capillus-veneris TaxID=13818 RepID=A0A9D4ZFU9_ADICA|nr:hypothetical protein GOP47_0011941 [Adiantum capillus-veneris]
MIMIVPIWWWWLSMVAGMVVASGKVVERVEWNGGGGSTPAHSRYFKSDILMSGQGFRDQLGASTRVADARSFPALEGEGLAMARIDLAPRGLNPPHAHPSCSSELFYVLRGSILVGFVHPSFSIIVQQTLQPGDLFLFPPGLVHFQLNQLDDAPALALSIFDSSLPVVSHHVAQQLFATNESSTC